MIYSITADRASFRTVDLRPGFNLILADKTKKSSKKQSRNGLGKTTLIEIVHFCLGSQLRKGATLRAAEVLGWSFTLDLDVLGSRVQVTRCTEGSSRVYVEGDMSTWPVKPSFDKRRGEEYFEVRQWNRLLGHAMFGLDPVSDEVYRPSFRSLAGYYARRGKGAFDSPFEAFRSQQPWDVQVSNTFLLGLEWRDARDFQLLKDKKKTISSLRQASALGLVHEFVGTVGDLEAELVTLETQAKREKADLSGFRVVDQYEQLEARADALTQTMRDLQNVNVRNRRRVTMYESSLHQEQGPGIDDVAAFYQSLGVELSGMVLRELEEVATFHEAVVHNREVYLRSEIARLETEIADGQRAVGEASEERAAIMRVLQAGGALEEYTRLQDLHTVTSARIEETRKRIADLRRLQRNTSELKIDAERLQQKALLDYEERFEARSEAIRYFNGNSEFLYSAPGKLIIDVVPNGYNFDVAIEKSGSQGIDKMKIFCYDLMLSQLWAGAPQQPGFLIHDSTLFDGVDERQRALALQLAGLGGGDQAFQYICLYNSDHLPLDELPRDVDIEDYVRLRLTDADASGHLLGISF